MRLCERLTAGELKRAVMAWIKTKEVSLRTNEAFIKSLCSERQQHFVPPL
jgi:hypothetical protein